MSSLRYRDDSPSIGSVLGGLTAGAVAGFAIGMVVAERFGGFSGLRARIKGRARALDERLQAGDPTFSSGDDLESDELRDDDLEADAELEERVLDAYRNDPILCERAVDIGAVGKGVIELVGWVHSEHERHHAATVAGGVPGVTSVVNRLDVGEDSDFITSRSDTQLDDTITDDLPPFEEPLEVIERIPPKKKRSKKIVMDDVGSASERIEGEAY